VSKINSSSKKLASADSFINQLKSNDESIDISDSFNVKSKTSYDKEKIYNLELDKLKKAPEEWNFYTPLNDDKMQELIESILNNGLLNPIIVWEIENESYMILAGHNRVRAYTLLVNEFKFNEFKSIPAIIKTKDSINEDDAKQIIIDTNWVQRSLSPIEKHKSIAEKYKYIEKNKKEYKGKPIRETVANYFDLSGRQVTRYLSISKLIPEVNNMFETNEITFKKALYVVKLNENLQRDIYNEDKNIFKGEYLHYINNDMTISDVCKIISKKDKLNRNTLFKIECNENDKDDIIKLINEFITRKGYDIKITCK
jgi:ParB family chromosome partitioning protein